MHLHSGGLVLIVFGPVSDVLTTFGLGLVLSAVDPVNRLSLLMRWRGHVLFILQLTLKPSTGAPYMRYGLQGTTGLG